MLFKLSFMNSNLALTLGYLNPALNNSAQETRDGVILWEFWSSVERGYFTSELSLPKSYNNSEKTVFFFFRCRVDVLQS